MTVDTAAVGTAVDEWMKHLPGATLDELADFEGFQKSRFVHEIDTVRHLMCGRDDMNGVDVPRLCGDFEISRLADSEGCIDGFEVELQVTTTSGGSFWLGSFCDWDEMTEDTDATGIPAAAAIARALLGERRLLEAALDEITTGGFTWVGR